MSNVRVPRQVLFIGTWGALKPLKVRLEELKLTIEEAADDAAARTRLQHLPSLVLLLVDSSYTPVDPAIVAEVKQTMNNPPAVWMAQAGAPTPSFESPPPDHILTPRAPVDIMLRQMDELLIKSIYQREVADVLRKISIDVLAESFQTLAVGRPPYLKVPRRDPADVMGMIAFSGEACSGYLAMSARRAHLLELHQRLLPKVHAASDEISRSVAGEVVNQILGRFKGYLAERGMQISMSFPIVVFGNAVDLTYRPGRVALVQSFRASSKELNIELCLDVFDPSALSQKKSTELIASGEVTFL